LSQLDRNEVVTISLGGSPSCGQTDSAIGKGSPTNGKWQLRRLPNGVRWPLRSSEAVDVNLDDLPQHEVPEYLATQHVESQVSTKHQTGTGDESATSVLSRSETKQPRRFAVVLHNDDYTTMEFVILVLTRFFGRNETEAMRIMLEVHHKGSGVAGVYVRDVAESKVEQVEEFARTEGHPLKCTTEPAEPDEPLGDESYGPKS